MEKITSIKKNHLFSQLYNKGKSHVSQNVVVYLRKNSSLDGAVLGITASKKLGGAVERNRARRIIKEAYRILIKEEPALNHKKAYIVIVARKRCFLPKTSMWDIYRDLKASFCELGLLS